jgi:hypothetical protein
MNYRSIRIWLTTCLFLGLATLSVAQTTTLTGIVADAVTGKPMPFANVYVDGSTHGTLTNEEGHYSLTGVPLGNVEIVASFVGYTPQKGTFRFEDGQTKSANFRLKPTDKMLASVTVHGNYKKWQQHLKQFKKQLLGEPFVGQCQIMNPDALNFTEERGHLKATAAEPVVIENLATGYRMWYDMLYFDGTSRKVYFAGTTRFEEMKPENERQANRFRRNRMIAYKGSTRHLMASLIDSTYAQEGFMVYQENMGVPMAKSLANRITLEGSVGDSSRKGHLQPINLNRLILPGRLPFERRLVSDKSLIVFYTFATSNYSPYVDARYAYSEIKLPTGQIQLTVDGTVTVPNGMEESGSLGDDRLSRMLPADWQPNKTDADSVSSKPVVAQGKLLPPDARMNRIATAFNDRFTLRAPVLFVHTDKPLYATGDRMWLSTYLLDASTNSRPLGETAVHLDLLTPAGKLVQHQWLRVTDGRAAGSFRLSDSLASGTYRLRAYTDEDDAQHGPAFERSIAVYNLVQPTVPGNPATGSKPLDVQFLPEGGRWITGLPARLGVKAIGPDGQGVLVSGRVVNNEGAEIARFKTSALGMGSIVLTPVDGRKYYAELAYNGQQQVVPLPAIESEGLMLSADVVSDTNRLGITITGTSRSAQDSAYILIQQQGRIVDQRKVLLENGVARVSLPLAGLPAGLNQLALYDASAHPQAERLFFIPDRLPPLRVLLGLNKTTYQPRERAILSVNLFDDGIPVVAALSASVTDVGQVPDDTAAATFQTHLLLTGELRGRVEQPNSYLKDNTPETRRALDDLLLTQGWRRVTGTPQTELLGGVSLMGRILDAKNQPIAGAQVIVASTTSDPSFVRSAGADRRGRFRLAGLPIADTVQLMTQLTDYQLKELPDKAAHLVLEGPGTGWEKDTTSRMPNWVALRAQLETARVRQEADADLYRDKTVKQLKEVVVRARRPDERPDDIRRRSIHNSADATLIFDENSSSFANLYEMIRGRLAGVNVLQITTSEKSGYQVLIRGANSVNGSTSPLFLIDGMAIQDQDGTGLLNFSPGDIERVELLKNGGTAGIYGVRGGSGVIAFYTKTYRPDQLKNEEKKGMKAVQLIGYPSVQREFYVPRYATESQPVALNDRIDRRDVLYWKPLMQTDGQGRCQVQFPLSDVVRTLRVTVQGISMSGRPVVGVTLIKVQ